MPRQGCRFWEKDSKQLSDGYVREGREFVSLETHVTPLFYPPSLAAPVRPCWIPNAT